MATAFYYFGLGVTDGFREEGLLSFEKQSLMVGDADFKGILDFKPHSPREMEPSAASDWHRVKILVLLLVSLLWSRWWFSDIAQ